MKPDGTEYKVIEGKTYSLFGNSDSPEGYYSIVSEITDELLSRGYSGSELLEMIRDTSRVSGILSGILQFSLMKKQLNSFGNFREPLYIFTKAVKEHLSRLPLSKLWDRRLSTTELQYHLYMAEIELTNRMNREIFRECTRKIALLPYCLYEFDHDCKAVAVDFDPECRNCSKTCFIGRASKLLRDHHIKPYIWMGSELKRFRESAVLAGEKPGVLGIACIPELTMGFRKCMKLGLPVIGLPLNANRCKRWMGAMYENSLFLEKLEELIR